MSNEPPRDHIPEFRDTPHSVHAPLSVDQYRRVSDYAIKSGYRSKGRALAALALQRLTQIEIDERVSIVAPLVEMSWGWEAADDSTSDDGTTRSQETDIESTRADT